MKSVEHKSGKRKDYLLARLEHIDVEPAVHGSKVETRMCYHVKFAKSGDGGRIWYGDVSQSLHNNNKLG